MGLFEYLPILVQLVLVAGLAAIILTASQLLGQRGKAGKIKDSPYECGIPATGEGHVRFSVKFYITAMLFILFDIEIVFLIPWILVFRDFLAANIPIVLPVFFFLTVLIVGLLYEIRKGALEWEK